MAVFLDRDGVLTRSIVRDGKPYAAVKMEEFEILPDALPALTRLKGAGFTLIVVTNQPDVRTGQLEQDTLEQMNKVLMASLPLDAVEVCTHVDADNCNCRKPKPGMLIAAAQKFDVNLSQSFMVGDRWRDVEAGHKAGCKTIWIQTTYREKKPEGYDAAVPTITEAAGYILKNSLSI